MKPKTVATVVLVLISSAAVSAFAWWSLVYPSATGRVPLSIVKILNTPPALVGIIYGRQTNGSYMSAVMPFCDFCSPRQHMVSYFAAALPAYALLFAALALGMRRVMRRQRTAT